MSQRTEEGSSCQTVRVVSSLKRMNEEKSIFFSFCQPGEDGGKKAECKFNSLFHAHQPHREQERVVVKDCFKMIGGYVLLKRKNQRTSMMKESKKEIIGDCTTIILQNNPVKGSRELLYRRRRVGDVSLSLGPFARSLWLRQKGKLSPSGKEGKQ